LLHQKKEIVRISPFSTNYFPLVNFGKYSQRATYFLSPRPLGGLLLTGGALPQPQVNQFPAIHSQRATPKPVVGCWRLRKILSAGRGRGASPRCSAGQEFDFSQNSSRRTDLLLFLFSARNFNLHNQHKNMSKESRVGARKERVTV
jgi:hypothetical protein